MAKWKLREVETQEREKDYECQICGTPAALIEGQLPNGVIVKACVDCIFRYCIHEAEHFLE